MHNRHRSSQTIAAAQECGEHHIGRNYRGCIGCKPDSVLAKRHASQHRILQETSKKSVLQHYIIDKRWYPERNIIVRTEIGCGLGKLWSVGGGAQFAVQAP